MSATSSSIKPDISVFLLEIVSNLPLVLWCSLFACIYNKHCEKKIREVSVCWYVHPPLSSLQTPRPAPPFEKPVWAGGCVRMDKWRPPDALRWWASQYVYTGHFVAHQVLLVFMHLACGPRKFFIVKTDLEKSGGWTSLIEVKPWGPRIQPSLVLCFVEIA